MFHNRLINQLIVPAIITPSLLAIHTSGLLTQATLESFTLGNTHIRSTYTGHTRVLHSWQYTHQVYLHRPHSSPSLLALHTSGLLTQATLESFTLGNTHIRSTYTGHTRVLHSWHYTHQVYLHRPHSSPSLLAIHTSGLLTQATLESFTLGITHIRSTYTGHTRVLHSWQYTHQVYLHRPHSSPSLLAIHTSGLLTQATLESFTLGNTHIRSTYTGHTRVLHSWQYTHQVYLHRPHSSPSLLALHTSGLLTQATLESFTLGNTHIRSTYTGHTRVLHSWQYTHQVYLHRPHSSPSLLAIHTSGLLTQATLESFTLGNTHIRSTYTGHTRVLHSWQYTHQVYLHRPHSSPSLLAIHTSGLLTQATLESFTLGITHIRSTYTGHTRVLHSWQYTHQVYLHRPHSSPSLLAIHTSGLLTQATLESFTLGNTHIRSTYTGHTRVLHSWQYTHQVYLHRPHSSPSLLALHTSGLLTQATLESFTLGITHIRSTYTGHTRVLHSWQYTHQVYLHRPHSSPSLLAIHTSGLLTQATLESFTLGNTHIRSTYTGHTRVLHSWQYTHQVYLHRPHSSPSLLAIHTSGLLTQATLESFTLGNTHIRSTYTGHTRVLHSWQYTHQVYLHRPHSSPSLLAIHTSGLLTQATLESFTLGNTHIRSTYTGHTRVLHSWHYTHQVYLHRPHSSPSLLALHTGVDTCICAILTAGTGLGDPVYCGNGRGSPYCSVYYRKVTMDFFQSHKVTMEFYGSHRVTEVFPVRSRGHSQILGSHKL